MLAFFVVRW